MYLKMKLNIGSKLDRVEMIEHLKSNGFELNYRIDQFSDSIKSNYIYYGFNGRLMEEATIEALEIKIQNHYEVLALNNVFEANIEYPVFVGTLPYEQACEFLKLNHLRPPGVTCIQSNIILAVHKTRDEVIFIIHDAQGGSVQEEATVENFFQCLNLSVAPKCLNSNNDTQDTLYCNLNYDDYNLKIQGALKEINEGEIFQVVLSEKLELPYEGSAYDYYLTANATHKANYSCYLNMGEEVSVTSPEMLVQYDDKYVRTKPIAGTRAIKTDGKDHKRIQTLVMDPKEGAEHLMLVDLGRNDLSKVCTPGTIRVDRYKEPLILEHVVHLLSEVKGERAFKKVFDPIRATFPAGTVSGAPKIRAMEIISELEKSERNLYAGSVFVLSSKQNFESCIAIRCATFKNGMVNLQVGSGIVYDSKTEDEFKEILNKASGNLKTYERLEAKHVSINRQL